MDIQSRIQDINKIIDEISAEYKNALKDEGIEDRKLLEFQTIVKIDKDSFEIKFDLPSYWKYMEYGRGPGKQPPVDVISNWIKVKSIIPDARSGSLPDNRQLAYLIARSIGRNGTKGKHILDHTLADPYVNSLVDDLKQAIVDVALLRMVEEIKESK